MKVSVILIFLSIVYLQQARAADNNDFASCPAGGIKDGTGKYCCPSKCGQCGGPGCDKRTGGSSACCTSKITKSCNTSGLPCIASGGSNLCPAGSIADSTKKVCCPAKCGTCGGSGCNLRPGGPAACCTSQITKSCTGNQPPCLASGTPTQKPKNPCPAGGILDASGKICCTGSCGTCGGSGCDKRPGGSANCCTSKVTASCGGGKLPCVLGATTPTPTPKPTPPPMSSGFCANGILSKFVDLSLCENVQGCCPKSCTTCFSGAYYDCPGPPECCVGLIAGSLRKTDVDVSCRYKGPPCIMPPADDPCAGPNPCQNGARCGVGFQYDSRSGNTECLKKVACECDAVGNYYGQYCELKCGEGETPCGEHSYTSQGNVVFPNDKCCAASEECIARYDKYSYEYQCFPKERPSTCDPDPCKNGAYCGNLSGGYGEQVPYCYCSEGFEGVYCEVPV